MLPQLQSSVQLSLPFIRRWTAAANQPEPTSSEVPASPAPTYPTNGSSKPASTWLAETLVLQAMTAVIAGMVVALIIG